MAGCVQRGRERVDDERAHEGRIAEAHLGLRRVHVNVDLVRRQRNEQRKQRVTPARHEVAVSCAHGADQQFVLHRAAVDEEILLAGIGAVQSRQPGKARDTHPSRVAGDRKRVVHELAAHDATEPLQHALGAVSLVRELQSGALPRR